MIFNKYISLVGLCALGLLACSRPQPGPDKTVGGAILGAGWGAGAGAVIGNELSYAGEGTAVGAGFGLVGGAISGSTYDATEETQIEQASELESLKIHNIANSRELSDIQSKLDQAVSAKPVAGIYQVFFDEDQTNLRSGAVANLEAIADSLRTSPHADVVNVFGHSDDAGTPEYNESLAEARARTVSAYLMSRGISSDQVIVKGFGSKRPIASNATPVGRQLNRRVDIYLGR